MVGHRLAALGLGALLAGTCYEAFSYQIKYAGRAACVWTSRRQIGYLFVSVAILIAQAFSNATGTWRKLLTGYALLNLSLYTLMLLAGALTPVKFLISFELLLVVGAPNIIIFIIQNGSRTIQFKRRMDAILLGAWIWA